MPPLPLCVSSIYSSLLFSLCNSLNKAHAAEFLCSEDASALLVVHECAHNNSGDSAFGRVGSVGTAKVCSAPAGVSEIDGYVSAFEVLAKVACYLVECSLCCGIACL